MTAIALLGGGQILVAVVTAPAALLAVLLLRRGSTGSGTSVGGGAAVGFLLVAGLLVSGPGMSPHEDAWPTLSTFGAAILAAATAGAAYGRVVWLLWLRDANVAVLRRRQGTPPAIGR